MFPFSSKQYQDFFPDEYVDILYMRFRLNQLGLIMPLIYPNVIYTLYLYMYCVSKKTAYMIYQNIPMLFHASDHRNFFCYGEKLTNLKFFLL